MRSTVKLLLEVTIEHEGEATPYSARQMADDLRARAFDAVRNGQPYDAVVMEFHPAPPVQQSINYAEAQEMHECIGGAIEAGDFSGLERAREIAAIVVSDTDPDREDDPVAGDAIGIEVSIYHSVMSHDAGKPVIQIDTPGFTGPFRVNVNDGAIWDADPNDHQHEFCSCTDKMMRDD